MIRLYYLSGSPFSWRVQLALEEKDVPYEPVLLSAKDGDLKTPEHLARSPHGKVPALTHGDVSLYESSAIVEYLEERFPDRPLLPADPLDRARARIEELECLEYFARTFLGVARQAFFTPAGKRDEEALARQRGELAGQLDALEARATATKRSFLSGDDLTRADVTWIPFVEIGARAGVDLDPARHPWLVAWRSRIRARPTYDRSYPPHWRS